MQMDINEANRILNMSNIVRNDSNEQNKERLFNELECIHLAEGYAPANDDDEEEIMEFMDTVKVEPIDIDYCLVREDPDDNIIMYFSVKACPEFDQHIDMAGYDYPDWICSSEQALEYLGKKSIADLKTELDVAGATYNKEMESWFT